MELVLVGDNDLINPEYIVSVKMMADKKLIIKTVDGEAHKVDVPTVRLLSVLAKSGVDLNRQFVSV